MHLVSFLEPAQDADGVLGRRLADQHRLEAAFESRVLLDAGAVLVQGGGADHAQLTAGKHGLEHVAGVHGAFGGTRADDRVQLVDEGDEPSLGGTDLVEDGLQPLLELAPQLRPGHHRTEVERDDAPAAQGLRHITGDDPQREPFDDRGLADTGFADKDRVVLRPPGQDLHDAADLGVASDDRVELAGAGLFGQVQGVFVQRAVGALGVAAGHPVNAAADGVERAAQGFGVRAELGEHPRCLTALLRECDQQVLDRGVFVAEPVRLAFGIVEDGDELPGQLRWADAGTGCVRQSADRCFGAGAYLGEGHADGPEQIDRDPAGLAQDGDQQVQRVDER